MYWPLPGDPFLLRGGKMHERLLLLISCVRRLSQCAWIIAMTLWWKCIHLSVMVYADTSVLSVFLIWWMMCFPLFSPLLILDCLFYPDIISDIIYPPFVLPSCLEWTLRLFFSLLLSKGHVNCCLSLQLSSLFFRVVLGLILKFILFLSDYAFRAFHYSHSTWNEMIVGAILSSLLSRDYHSIHFRYMCMFLVNSVSRLVVLCLLSLLSFFSRRGITERWFSLPCPCGGDYVYD